MVIIYDGRPKINRRFGKGVLRSLPAYKCEFTAEDAAWLAEQQREAENREADRMAEVAAFEDRYAGGWAF